MTNFAGSNQTSAEKCREILEGKFSRLESYSAVAREVGNVSPALVWKILEEGAESRKMERELDLRPREYRRCAHFGYGPDAKRLTEEWDTLAEQWGGMTGLALGILNGELKVTEVE